MSLPITIISGYLGAGKTTLVNHLLRAANGLRIAVMVNEFGDLPIDEDLIESQDEDMMALAGGCVCCSYGDDLMAALQTMASLDPPADHIVLEASGVALPGAIASSLSLLPNVVNDGIVVVADAETIYKRASDKFMADTVMRQLTDADIILLNKVDLVDETSPVHDWLTRTAPQAIIIPCEQGQVEPSTVLQSFIGRSRGAYLTQAHRNPMKSKTVQVDGLAALEGLAQRLAQNDAIIRAKGFATTAKGTKLLQLVGRRWTVSDVAGDKPDGIVVIGTDLSET